MTVSEIIDFYKNSTKDELVKKADEVCRENYSDEVFLRGLIEFSNYCRMDCLYCGIRKSNKNVYRYRLTKEEILETVKKGFTAGLKTFVLQSGEDSHYSPVELCRLMEKIKKITDNKAAVTLSCGIFSKQQYKDLKKAGADRYLIRFETSDEKLHSYLRNGISFKKRIRALHDLTECGYEVGSGYMVGLPGETEEIRLNNALLCKKLELDMIGIGPFIPHNETPLKDENLYDISLTIKQVALVRLLLPKTNIPATTAAGTLDSLGREKMLEAGANVLMPNITPSVYKKHYLLYPDKICINESGFECISCLSKRTFAIGKKICFDKGNSKSFLARAV